MERRTCRQRGDGQKNVLTANRWTEGRADSEQMDRRGCRRRTDGQKNALTAKTWTEGRADSEQMDRIGCRRRTDGQKDVLTANRWTEGRADSEQMDRIGCRRRTDGQNDVLICIDLRINRKRLQMPYMEMLLLCNLFWLAYLHLILRVNVKIMLLFTSNFS